MPYVIGLAKVGVYYRQGHEIPWTVSLDDATTFATVEDARARAHVELGLEGKNYLLLEVPTPADRRQYEQYVASFPLSDPRD